MARRFGRRRKPRVVWLRPTGTPQDSVTNGFEQPGAIILDGTALTLGSGAQPVIEIPLVLDQPTAEQFLSAPLTVVQQTGINQQLEWGYRLRRIVGSIHLAAINDNLGQNPAISAVLVTAGIIVRRTDETGLSPLTGLDTNPATINNWTDPWVWRRTWVLNAVENPALTATAFNETTRFAFSRFPLTTDAYGDMRSGPHVDAKTARRIGPEERLFMDISFLGLPISTGPGIQETVTVRGVIDLRCLATLSSNSGNRRNASR